MGVHHLEQNGLSGDRRDPRAWPEDRDYGKWTYGGYHLAGQRGRDLCFML